MVEEGLQQLEMELVATQVIIHPQEVMQVAEEFFPEEEEAQAKEEKLDVIYVTS